MKQLILAALKTKFEGVSEAVLDRIANKLAKTVASEADVQTTVDGVTIQQVIDSYADGRATEASTTAVKNYETKHKIKDGKPVETPKPVVETPKPTEEGNEAMKALLEQVKALSDEMKGLKAERTGNSRRAKLTGVLKDAPEKLRQRYEKDFDRYNFKDDEDFDNWLNEITPEITELSTEFKAKGTVTTPPKGQHHTETPGEASEAVKARAQRTSEAAKAAPSAIRGLDNAQ